MNLDLLRSVPGLVAGSLVGHDGLTISSVGDGADALSAELTSLRGCISRISERMGAGRVTRLAFTTERMEIIAMVSGDYVLGAAIMRGNDTRLVQQVLARLALDIVHLPEGES